MWHDPVLCYHVDNKERSEGRQGLFQDVKRANAERKGSKM